VRPASTLDGCAGYDGAYHACANANSCDQAVHWTERGVQVADAAGNANQGAQLRYNLGNALLAQANSAGARLEAGRLLRLLAEAQDREQRCKAWVVRACRPAAHLAGLLLRPRNQRLRNALLLTELYADMMRVFCGGCRGVHCRRASLILGKVVLNLAEPSNTAGLPCRSAPSCSRGAT